jgi:hypothetical protein
MAERGDPLFLGAEENGFSGIGATPESQLAGVFIFILLAIIMIRKRGWRHKGW